MEKWQRFHPKLLKNKLNNQKNFQLVETFYHILHIIKYKEKQNRRNTALASLDIVQNLLYKKINLSRSNLLEIPNGNNSNGTGIALKSIKINLTILAKITKKFLKKITRSI